MNKYTFEWNLSPPAKMRFEYAISPFDVKVEEKLLTLTANGQPEAARQLRDAADKIARNAVRTLTYQFGDKFDAVFAGSRTLHPTGQQTVDVEIQSVVVLTMSGTAEVVSRDAAGKVIDSSAMQRERDRIVAQSCFGDLMQRAVRDVNLRDMLDHWARYTDDPDGRLHPLYDILQVAERVYGNRKKAALALGLTDSNLDPLGGTNWVNTGTSHFSPRPEPAKQSEPCLGEALAIAHST